MTYTRLGDEHPDDLEVLCRGCHDRADDERREAAKAAAAERLWDARVEGWARKRYGDNYEFIEPEIVEEEFRQWLDWNGEPEWGG